MEHDRLHDDSAQPWQIAAVRGKAIIFRRALTRVSIAQHEPPPAEVADTSAVVPGLSIVLVEVSTPGLAAWLATAINALLDQCPMPARPAGTFWGRTFFCENEIVFTWHPQKGRVDLARCLTGTEAQHLAAHLNALISSRAWSAGNTKC